MTDTMQAAAPNPLLTEAAALAASGNYEEAVQLCRPLAATSGPNQVDALCTMAVIGYRMGDWANAIKLLSDVQDNPAASGDVHEALAVLNGLAGNLQESLFQAKMFTAKGGDGRILKLFGEDFPDFPTVFANIKDRPLLALARARHAEGRNAAAAFFLEQHISMVHGDVDALLLMSELQLQQGEAEKAVQLLRYVRALQPDEPRHLARLAAALNALGQTDMAGACLERAAELVPDDVKIACAWLRHLQSLEAPAETRGRVMANLTAALGITPDPAPPRPVAGRRPVVGYLCAGLPAEDAALLAEVLRLRQSHDAVCYGAGALHDRANLIYQSARVKWLDIAALDPYTTAAVVKGDGVDVLIDLCGLASPTSLPLLALHPAPVQAGWLNQPAGFLLPGIDHLLSQTMGGGIRAFAPASTASAPEARDSYGADVVPENITPRLVLAWARLLADDPDSRLLLRNPGLSSAQTTRIIDAFGNFGLANRIDVISMVSSELFAAMVDVLLLPFNPVRPQQIADALTQGTAVVGVAPLIGEAADVLAAAGHAESMTATDAAGYLSLARSWRDAHRLAEFRANLPTLLDCPLFDRSALARSLEDSIIRLLPA